MAHKELTEQMVLLAHKALRDYKALPELMEPPVLKVLRDYKG